jgi:hypothetical protein
VYTAFFDDLEQRIEQGENPDCFARGIKELASKYGLDEAQTYFTGESMILRLGFAHFSKPGRV